MSEVSYSAQTIDVPNPLVPLARAQLAVGVMELLVAGWGLARFRLVMADLFGSPAFSLGQIPWFVVFGFALAWWLMRAISDLWHGVRGLGPQPVPPRTPVDLPSLKVVEDALVHQEFRDLRVPSKLAWIQRFSGGRAFFGTPRQFRLMYESLRWIRYAMLFVAAIAFYRFFASVSSQASPWLGGNLPYTFAIVASVALRIIAIPMLVLMQVPIANRDEHTRMVRGGGDPNSLLPMIWQEFLRMRVGETPNRELKDIKARRGTVKDTGEYVAQMWVETQPLSDSSITSSPLTWLYLGGGVAFTAVGLVFAALGLLGPTVMSVLANTRLALVWTFIGRGLLVSARVHLSRYRYTSTIGFIMAEGTIGRTEIKAGKGLNDSFESANLVVRSDSTMRLYSASLLTEAYEISGNRCIIRADRDAKSAEAMQTLNRAVDAYEKAGIIVRPIEPTDAGLNELAQANLAFRQASSLVTGGAAAPPRLEASSGSGAPFLVPASTAAPEPVASGDSKVCPMCAETVKAAALKCRFCGHMFEA